MDRGASERLVSKFYRDGSSGMFFFMCDNENFKNISAIFM